MKGIALFGGTFDPIHVGHLRGILEAREILEFDKTFIIPAGVPPHKAGRKRSAPGDRLEMARLSCEEIEAGEVSSFEIESGGPSFTMNTLQYFIEKFGEPVVLVMGSDSLLEIKTWHRYQDILSMAHIATLPRPGFLDKGSVLEVEKSISPVKIIDVKSDYTSDGTRQLSTDLGKKIYILGMNRLNISSTDIRKRVRSGRSIKFLVTEKVEKYIIEKRLYQEV